MVSSYNPVIQNWWWGHNFPRKVSIDFSEIRGSRLKGEKRKESEPVIFRKLTFLKRKVNRVSSYFFFWSLWCRVIWMLTFWGNCDITIGFGSTRKHKCTIAGKLVMMIRDKRDFFSRAISSTLSDIISSSVFRSHMRPFAAVECLNFSKIVLTFFMMSEVWWTVKNVVFFSKWSIIIKLPVRRAS